MNKLPLALGNTTATKRLLAWCAITMVSMATGWILVALNTEQDWQTIREQNQINRGVLQRNQSHYRQLQEQTTNLNKEIQHTSDIAPLAAQIDINTFSTDLNRLAAQHDMRLTHLLPGGAGQEEFYQFFDVQIKLSGNYQNLIGFIDDLNRLAHPVRLMELGVEQVDTGDPSPLDIQLKIRGFCCAAEVGNPLPESFRNHPLDEQIEDSQEPIVPVLTEPPNNETPAKIESPSTSPTITHAQAPPTQLQPQARPQARPQASKPAITIVPIHHTRAQEVADLLGILHDKEHRPVIVDQRTNALILNSQGERLEKLQDAILALDVPTRQVLIEAIIVIARQDFAKRLGINLRFGGGDAGNTIAGTLAPTSVLSASAPFSFLNTRGRLEFTLDAMESSGNGEVISRPRLVTSNLQTAYIKAGTQIPFEESAENGRTTVQFKDAVLRLDVTPTIMPDNNIQLDLIINQDSPGATINTGVSQLPTIDTTELRTQIVLKPHETAALGGVFRYDSVRSKSKTPILGDLPLLGYLFRRTNKNIVKSETIFFITPRILDNAPP